jgi:hypothetical protein
MAVLRNRRPPTQDAPWLRGPSLKNKKNIICAARQAGGSIKGAVWSVRECAVALAPGWAASHIFEPHREQERSDSTPAGLLRGGCLESALGVDSH